MVRHNNLSAVGDDDVGCGYASVLKLLHFLDEVLDAESYAVADDVGDILMKYARRELMQRKFAVIVDDGVTCVRTALKADNDVAVIG